MEKDLVELFKANETSAAKYLKDALTNRGLSLSEKKVRQLITARTCALKETGRVEFSPEGFIEFVERIMRLPVLLQGEALDGASEAVELFYSVRSKVSVEVSDAEVSEAICAALIAKEGVVAEVDHGALCDLLEDSAGSQDDSYSIADSEGRMYYWNPSDWAYEEHTAGWYGETWEVDDE